MDYQILVNIAVGVVTLMGGWVFKMMIVIIQIMIFIGRILYQKIICLEIYMEFQLKIILIQLRVLKYQEPHMKK